MFCAVAFREQQRKRDKRRFSFADLNKSGWLSSDELLSVFHPEESPHMFAVIVEVRLVLSLRIMFLLN